MQVLRVLIDHAKLSLAVDLAQVVVSLHMAAWDGDGDEARHATSAVAVSDSL